MTESKDDARNETDAAPSTADVSDRIQYGDQDAHLAFQRQLAELLDQADITEQQRQEFLIAASCPCCGAGGLSFSLKLKSDKPPQF